MLRRRNIYYAEKEKHYSVEEGNYAHRFLKEKNNMNINIKKYINYFLTWLYDLIYCCFQKYMLLVIG